MIGKVVSQYRITEYLGRGDMGEVYKAQHLTLDMTVAIKFIPESFLGNEHAKKQFRRGAQALAALDHRNICRFYEVGETSEGRMYVVMSFCEGETLQAKMARGRLDIKEALEIARDVASGLAHAHSRKVVHRDIKPANVMFDKDGVVKIVDFGLAKLIDQSKLSSGDTTGGTLLYMSPEQLNNDHVDGRADIFGLGDVLYEMLTGTHPFHAVNAAAVMFRICNDFPKSLREVRSDVAEDVEEIIKRALQKDPQVRYQTAGEMRDNLQAAIDNNELAPLKRRRRLSAKLAVAFALVAAAITIVVWYFWPSPPPPPASIGVAVYSAEQDAGTAEERALVSGFAHDLTDRIRFFARHDSLLWAVTPDRIQRAELRGPDKVKNLLGANLAIAVRALTVSGRQEVELQSYDVASPLVFKERRQIDLANVFDSSGIDEALRQLIDVESDSSTGGYTHNAEAYRDYLVGLGHLDAQPAAVDRGISFLERAVGSDSTFASAWAVLGEAYRLRWVTSKDISWATKAELACRRALALYNQLSDALVTIGQIQATQGEPDAAIRSFQEALAIDSRNNSASVQLAAVHTAEGHEEDAEATYQKAVEANPYDPVTHAWLGYFYYMHDRNEDAIAPLKLVSRLTPLDGPNYNMLGACYFAIDCWDEALAEFTQSFDLGRNFMACSNLGLLHYMNREYLEAAQMYQWAREYSPTSTEVVGYLAASRYWIPGERDTSIALYREAIEMTEERRRSRPMPNEGRRFALLAGYYAIVSPDSVESFANRATTLMPDDSEVNYRTALAYEIVGRRETALKLLGRALDLGHSLRQVEAEPFLSDLRRDPRYQVLTRGLKRSPRECTNL